MVHRGDDEAAQALGRQARHARRWYAGSMDRYLWLKLMVVLVVAGRGKAWRKCVQCPPASPPSCSTSQRHETDALR